jgi:hypothetical protein
MEIESHAQNCFFSVLLAGEYFYEGTEQINIMLSNQNIWCCVPLKGFNERRANCLNGEPVTSPACFGFI